MLKSLYNTCLKNKNKNMKQWWMHSFAHGEHFTHLTTRNKHIVGLSYFLFLIGMFIFLIVATTLALVGCTHHLMLYYLTYWTLFWILLSSTLTTFVTCHIRRHYYKNFWYATELNTTREIDPPLYVRVTRIVYVIAFIHSIIVFCLYTMMAIIDKSQVTIDVVSAMVHFCAPVLMFIQFWFSGIPIYMTDCLFVSIFVNVYITFTAFHHRFRLGRWAHPNLSCAASYKIVIESLRADPTKHAFVYSQYVLKSWDVFIINGLAVLVIIPLLVILLIKTKANLYRYLHRESSYVLVKRNPKSNEVESNTDTSSINAEKQSA